MPLPLRLVCLLAAVSIGEAQDVFNATTVPSNCEASKAAIRERYNQTCASIEQKRRDAQAKVPQQRAACGTGDQSKKCLADVDRQYGQENERLNEEEYQAGTDRDKALADVARNVCGRSTPLRGGVSTNQPDGGTAAIGGGVSTNKNGGSTSSTGGSNGAPKGAAVDPGPCIMAASARQQLSTTQIDSARDLVRLIFSRYGTNQPIGIVRH